MKEDMSLEKALTDTNKLSALNATQNIRLHQNISFLLIAYMPKILI
jgi:hypothetical protein